MSISISTRERQARCYGCDVAPMMFQMFCRTREMSDRQIDRATDWDRDRATDGTEPERQRERERETETEDPHPTATDTAATEATATTAAAAAESATAAATEAAARATVLQTTAQLYIHHKPYRQRQTPRSIARLTEIEVMTRRCFCPSVVVASALIHFAPRQRA